MPRTAAMPFRACAIRSACASLSIESGPAIRRSGAPPAASTPSAMRMRGDGIVILEGDGRAARLLVAVRRGDELPEERVGSQRARLVFRVELARQEPRVVRILDDLDELPVGREPRDLHPGGFELGQELPIYLVAGAIAVDGHVPTL